MRALELPSREKFSIKAIDSDLVMVSTETELRPPEGYSWRSIAAVINRHEVRALRDWCDEFLKGCNDGA